jgi:hypothetical protein
LAGGGAVVRVLGKLSRDNDGLAWEKGERETEMKIRIEIEANVNRGVTLSGLDGVSKEDVEAHIQEIVDQMASGEEVISQWSWVEEPAWEEAQAILKAKGADRG